MSEIANYIGLSNKKVLSLTGSGGYLEVSMNSLINGVYEICGSCTHSTTNGEYSMGILFKDDVSALKFSQLANSTMTIAVSTNDTTKLRFDYSGSGAENVLISTRLICPLY